jgi:Icc-related predicted phosphoesterase
MGNEDNTRERMLLLPEIARANPAFIVMLGDLVAWGASTSEWEEFDQRATTVRQKGISVFAVSGNHDYYGGERLRHYFERLPHLHNQRWYSQHYGPLKMIFLDGNAGPLTAKPWSEQRDWYKQELNSLAKEVLGVIVFVHQAPLTNGSVVSDDQKVGDDLVPMFANNKKTMAMLSGHSHSYERFERGAKTYIVTGGGGGPRRPLLEGTKRRHTDDKFNGPAMRNFNFIEFTVYAFFSCSEANSELM